jgi:hypothetical protein
MMMSPMLNLRVPYPHVICASVERHEVHGHVDPLAWRQQPALRRQ